MPPTAAELKVQLAQAEAAEAAEAAAAAKHAEENMTVGQAAKKLLDDTELLAESALEMVGHGDPGTQQQGAFLTTILAPLRLLAAAIHRNSPEAIDPQASEHQA